MAERDLTLDLPPMRRSAEIQPETIDPEKRTVEVVWTTGARVLRGFFERYWEELSLDPKHVRMDRLNNGAPFLNAHDGNDAAGVIGVVQSARLAGKEGRATIRFAKAEDDPEADRIFRKVKDKILRKISIGYRTYKAEKVEDGADKIPVYRAVDWEPHELSVVPVGADDGAGFREATNQAPNPCIFTRQEQTKEQIMADPKPPTTDGTGTVEEVTRAALAARKKENEETAAEIARRTEANVQAERDRIAGIWDVSRRAKMGDTWAMDLINKNIPVVTAREIAFNARITGDEETQITSHVRIGAGEDRRDKFIAAGAASIIERAGHLDTVERGKQVPRLASAFRGVVTDPGEFSGMRLTDLARVSLERQGVSVRGLFGEALIKRALEYRADAGQNVTGDFAVLLETAMNKIFLGAYAIAGVTWPLWCGRKSVTDFRTSTFYRPGTFGVLDTVTEAGEIKHKNVPDGMKRTLTPGTKGNIIGLTRRAMVNDDLGAFRELASELGKAAALSVETDAFAMVTANSGLGIAYGDGQNVFHSTHSNIGPTGAMSATTLDGARATMAKQKDASGNQYLAMRPSVWLGPVELGGTAKQFNSSTTDPTDNKAQGVANKVLNLFRDVVDSPFLSAQSATRHYLLADPGVNPAFVVGFIDGSEAPRIESEQLFGYDGFQMRIILDYGVAVLDYRSAVTCAGS